MQKMGDLGRKMSVLAVPLLKGINAHDQFEILGLIRECQKAQEMYDELTPEVKCSLDGFDRRKPTGMYKENAQK